MVYNEGPRVSFRIVEEDDKKEPQSGFWKSVAASILVALLEWIVRSIFDNDGENDEGNKGDEDNKEDEYYPEKDWENPDPYSYN